MKKKIIGKIILGCAVMTMLLGSVVGAATLTITKYSYASSSTYGIRATTTGANAYVTTWAEASATNGVYDYDSNRGYNTSSADASVQNPSGTLTRSAGYNID
ncbi:MAG: hypothetical protein ACYDG2_03410 [Ruminiclostridium sp.]